MSADAVYRGGHSCFRIFLAAVWMPFDTVTDGEFSDGTLRTNTLHGTAQTVDGKDGQAMVLDGNTVLSVGDWRHACFWNPEKCDSGFTVAFWMYNIKRNVST